jgi:Fe-S cluster assembly protein SufD
LDHAGRLPTVLMVNGHPELSGGSAANINGIEINSLLALSRVNPDLLLRFLQPLSDADQQRWALLNTALFIDGLYIKINADVPTPLLLLHLGKRPADKGPGLNDAAYPRVIIEAAPGSRATIIEHHITHGEHDSQAQRTALCNSATQIALGRGAELEHYRVFATDAGTTIDTLGIRQDKDSRCRQFTIALGGGLVRTTLEAHLNQPGAALDSYSLLVGHDSRHVDCVNIVTHAAPDTRSRQTARAIAGGVSRVVFNSKVIVNAGATHADSQQSCRGLLLSPGAEIDSRPQLEIHTDEVKCAHGASTGRLDPDMLFYMLSRGLDRDTAQSLLVFAFLADVLTGMSQIPARVAIESALIAQLPNSEVLRKFQ